MVMQECAESSNRPLVPCILASLIQAPLAMVRESAATCLLHILLPHILLTVTVLQPTGCGCAPTPAAH
jgi:hypothetical protein